MSITSDNFIAEYYKKFIIFNIAKLIEKTFIFDLFLKTIEEHWHQSELYYLSKLNRL